MPAKNYRPGPPENATAERDGDRWMLVFVRELRHAPERVWEALTEPAQLREWAPFDADRNLGTAGAASLTMAGGEASAEPITVRRAERPRLLEYDWGTNVLRWELEPSGSGTRLTLRHTADAAEWLPKLAAGWQICLEVMDRALAGDRLGRIVGNEARDYGWEALNARYAEILGIADTGLPL